MLLLKPIAAAERLNISLRAVVLLLRSHQIAGLKVAGKWRIPPPALDAYIAAQVAASTPPTRSARPLPARRVPASGAAWPLPGADRFLQ